MTTKVIHCKSGELFDVYIGRENSRAGLPESIWANPFKIGLDGTREDVIRKYRKYIESRKDLIKRLPELRDKTLACWCAPKPCHGDVLIELLNKHYGDASDQS